MSYQAFARYYDALTKNVDYPAKAKFISQLLKAYKPGCALITDLACGTGNLSVELSSLGFEVIGVDMSADMLSIASAKGGGIMYLCQPVEKLDLFGTVDAMVCVLDSVNHITNESKLQRAFSRVSLFLEPDGVFIFDANTEYKHRRVLGDNTFIYDTPEVYCVWQNSTDDGLLTKINLDFFEKDGAVYRRSSESFGERAYTHNRLVEMLDEAGLFIVEEFDDYRDAPPFEESERIVYLCRKKGIR